VSRWGRGLCFLGVDLFGLYVLTSSIGNSCAEVKYQRFATPKIAGTKIGTSSAARAFVLRPVDG
jgi:hypothetical protein